MDSLLSIPDAKAKSILLALCFDDALLAKKAATFLSQINQREKMRPQITQATNVKRKAESAIEVCTRCHEPFYEDDNVPKSCTYHEGTCGCPIGIDVS
jgi:cytochrome c553